MRMFPLMQQITLTPRRKRSGLLLPFFLLLAVFWTCMAQAASQPASQDAQPWRIRFLEAAIVSGPVVKLGEIAVPAGDIPKEQWEKMAARELWPAPDESGRPMHMTRPRLQEAVVRTMKDLAPYCLFPPSMAVQRGGTLVDKPDIRRLVEKELAPILPTLAGETQLADFRLPPYIFLNHSGQKLEMETPRKLAPGRLSVRLLVREVDGSIKQKLTGSVFVDCWTNVPVATTSMNRDELLEPGNVTFRRVNLANLRGEAWDGKGGPWRVLRPLTVDQVIYKADVGYVPTVRKGDKLTLVYEGKTVRLTVPVEALSDGAVGENISVRNLDSRKEIFATVRDSNNVVVNSSR